MIMRFNSNHYFRAYVDADSIDEAMKQWKTVWAEYKLVYLCGGSESMMTILYDSEEEESADFAQRMSGWFVPSNWTDVGTVVIDSHY